MILLARKDFTVQRVAQVQQTMNVRLALNAKKNLAARLLVLMENIQKRPNSPNANLVKEAITV